METVLLLNIETFNNPDYNDEWRVFDDWWCFTETYYYFPTRATPENWNQIYLFQLLVKEARKDLQFD